MKQSLLLTAGRNMNTKSLLNDLKAERDRLNKAIAALESLNSPKGTGAGRGRPPATKVVPKPRRKRRLTPAGRKRLSEMMKARWAARRKKAGKPEVKKTRGRRRMSAAARKKLSALAKQRWAARKKAGGTTL
jgi:hypothetical protein